MKTLKQKDPESPPAAPAAPSKPSISVDLSSANNKEYAPDVFVALVKEGVNAWQRAGMWLVAFKGNHKDAFEIIINQYPWVSASMLETFYAIGTKEIHPKALLIGDVVIGNAVLAMPYADQDRAFSGQIEVVVGLKEHGEPVVEKKFVSQMVREEVRLCLGASGIRTVSQQSEILQKQNRRCGAHHEEHKADPPPKAAVSFGKYSIVMENGQEPVLKRLLGDASRYDMQRVKLVTGSAVIELYM